MRKNLEKTVFEYAETVRPGELVLVEYTSEEPVYLLLYEVLKYARHNGIPYAIVDVLDGLHVMKAQFRFAGLDTSPIDDAPVIKIGGRLDTGSVLATIDERTELPILKRRFMEFLERVEETVGGESFIRIVVGATELLQQLENDPMKREEFFASIIRPMIGNPESRGLVFINRKRVNGSGLREAEEMSTRVLRTRIENGRLVITVVKSIYFDEYRSEVVFESGAIGGGKNDEA
ncbi:DUF257 family protein [Thermococcus sp. 21S7]|uniref:DUF257 family protein n=1 Tax=Thermococcus sp. 21S7 TaxID=1638221 RepID=UPI00143B10B3